MGPFIMDSRKLLLLVMILGLSQISRAQSPTYGVGRTPTPEEVSKWDITIGPDGQALPPGHGTAVEGAGVFVRKACFACHGETGSGGPAPTLIRSDGKTNSQVPCLSPCVSDSNLMAFHSPYATTIWDYINRAMPLTIEGTLKPNEVYALTAYILYKNGIIKEDEVMDEHSLPKVQMPNRDHFALAPEWKHGTPRLQGYP
jgi:S-disulfanyl-L-cysteine oxidoreductase SoxD